MKAYEAVRKAIEIEGLSARRVSEAMGRTPSYIASQVSRGSDPTAPVLSEMLEACGYRLCAVPADEVPAGALVITSDDAD